MVSVFVLGGHLLTALISVWMIGRSLDCLILEGHALIDLLFSQPSSKVSDALPSFLFCSRFTNRSVPLRRSKVIYKKNYT